jgi:ribosomal protein S18 acetylase RimI-like enzyme
LKSFNFDEYLSRYLRTSYALSAIPSITPTAEEGAEPHPSSVPFINECARLNSTAYEHSFASRLNGLSNQPRSASAPPYIRREYGLYPLGLQFLQEIAFISGKKADALNSSGNLVRSASPIDFIPLAVSHLNQCNALLESHFWPGINITDCISFKTGIVALYRKLVVGVGVVTPDGYLMYLAVRPHWKGHGLGRMMMWWLVKENDKVDITLHVAADNPALVPPFPWTHLTSRLCTNPLASKQKNILWIFTTNFTRKAIDESGMRCF